MSLPYNDQPVDPYRGPAYSGRFFFHYFTPPDSTKITVVQTMPSPIELWKIVYDVRPYVAQFIGLRKQ